MQINERKFPVNERTMMEELRKSASTWLHRRKSMDCWRISSQPPIVDIVETSKHAQTIVREQGAFSKGRV